MAKSSQSTTSQQTHNNAPTLESTTAKSTTSKSIFYSIARRIYATITNKILKKRLKEVHTNLQEKDIQKH